MNTVDNGTGTAPKIFKAWAQGIGGYSTVYGKFLKRVNRYQ